MTTVLRLAAAFAVALASSSAARAGNPLDTFDTAPREPATYAPPPRNVDERGASRREAPAIPDVRFVIQSAADFGQTTAVKLYLYDGSSKTLRYNQGASAAVGLAFLPLLDGALATQATLGVEYAAISASNQDARWLAFPLEVLEIANLEPLRLAAGLSCLLAPSVKAEGDFLTGTARLKTSVGLLVEAGLMFRYAQSARGAYWWVTGRYASQRVQSTRGGPTEDASAFGVVLGTAL